MTAYTYNLFDRLNEIYFSLLFIEQIEKAYKILVGETTPKEKGYVPALYANIKKCHPDKHIHIFTNKIDFLDALIRRAEPEVNGR